MGNMLIYSPLVGRGRSDLVNGEVDTKCEVRRTKKLFEKQVKELMDYYGLERHIASEIVASHSQDEVEAILNFYANYGKLIKLK